MGALADRLSSLVSLGGNTRAFGWTKQSSTRPTNVMIRNSGRMRCPAWICQTVVNPLVANISPLTSATGPGHQDIHRLPYRPAQNRPKPSLLDGNREHETRLHWTQGLRSEIFSSVAHTLSPSAAHLYSGIVSKSIPFPLP
jgi:hypothetical protein